METETPLPTRSRSRRRWTARLAVVTAAVLVAAGCNGTWGIRQSYRNYLTSPIAAGSITTADGATWAAGTGTGKGPFKWPIESSSYNPTTKVGSIQFGGTVHTVGHQTPGGWVLDSTFSRPRLAISGNTATLYVDLVYRPYVGTNPDPLPAMQTATGLAFAKVDLTGQDLVADANGKYTIKDAPTTGVKASMKKIGWDLFYGEPVALDAFTVTFSG